MSGPERSPESSVPSEWLQGPRQNQITAGLLWAAAALVYWLDTESITETGDLVVGVIFAGLGLFYLARGLVGGPATQEDRERCLWSWGW